MTDISATVKRLDKFDPGVIFENRPLGRYAAAEPTALTGTQEQVLRRYEALVSPCERKAAYRDAVMSRLAGGTVGDGAVRQACMLAAHGFIAKNELTAHGLLFAPFQPNENRSRGTTPKDED